jgi:hypothetical protein
MSVIPPTRIGKVQFYENHIAPWTTNAAAIGVQPSAVTDLQTKTEAARDAYNAAQAAADASKAATLTYYNAVSAMATAGTAILKNIRAKADGSGDGVYALAQIPPPATPSPVGPPGTPFGLGVTLNPDGSVELKWKCENPAGSTGTLYHVYRQIGTGAEFSFIGGAGERKFTDATVPAGTPTVVYKIQGVRTSAIGVAGEFIVRFGVIGSGGAMTATVVESGPTSPKMAA